MDKQKEKSIKSVSIISMSCNFILFVLKFIFGVLSKSQSMIADSINSAGDIFASLVSFVGVKVASKPNDKEHPYGHGKAEYIFSLFIGISMVVAALIMIKNALFSIIEKAVVEYSNHLVLVCVVTITVKVLLMIYSRSQYKKHNSILIKSNFEDQRNDVFVTTGVLIGIFLSKYQLYFIDGIIGIIISLWIIYTGIKIIHESYLILMDTQGDFINKAKNTLSEFNEVISIDKFIANLVGEKYIAIIEISMDKNKNLEYIHKYVEKIEKKLLNEFEMLLDVTIHVNPK